MGGLRPRLLFLSVGMAALAGQTPQELLDKVRLNVSRNSERMPKYICLQRQERRVYEETERWGWNSCADLWEARRKHGRDGLRLTSTQRLRLEVTVANSTEVFSWPGGEAFETEEVKNAVRHGISGTGDFGVFLGGIFLTKGVAVKYLGERLEDGRTLAEFSYRVPVESSGYTYIYPKGKSIVGYQGTFWADPATALLERVTVEATDLPPESSTCRLATEMRYQKLHIGEADFLLPQVAMLTLAELSGREGQNQTFYSSCRQYLGESMVRFDDPAMEAAAQRKEPTPDLPSGLALRIMLTTPIDPTTVAAGAPVEGVLKEALRDKAGKILAPAKTVVHGRIMHFEERLWPAQQYVLNIKFDRIERGGASQLIWLSQQRADAPAPARSPGDPLSGGRTIPIIMSAPKEAATFVVDSERLRQGRLVSEWKTVERPSTTPQR